MARVSSPAEMIWADLLEGNRRFRAGKPAVRELVRRRQALAKGQQPQVVVLACADSRVSPSLLFDKNLGDLFEVRTAGNLADPVALGSLEFAAEYLGSPVLVIMGHEGCGAVAAAASDAKPPTPNLKSIVAKIRPALETLQASRGSSRFLRLAERANVHLSSRNILQKSPLLRKKVSAGNLTLIKALYRLRTGQVIRLPDEPRKS